MTLGPNSSQLSCFVLATIINVTAWVHEPMMKLRFGWQPVRAGMFISAVWQCQQIKWCLRSLNLRDEFFFEERYYLYSFPKHVFWKYKYLEITWINCNVNYVETERLYDLTSWPVLKPHTSVLQFVLRYETPTLVVISEYSDRCEETLVVGMACVVTWSNIWHG